MPATEPPLRLAEISAALALASDLAIGQPMEHLLRGCLAALRLGEAAGMRGEALRDVYYASLLRWVGCTAHAHEISALYGDELAFRARFAPIDVGDLPAVGREIARSAAPNRHGLGRAIAVAAAILGARADAKLNFSTSCEVNQILSARLGFGAGVREALARSFERWDGRGFPAGLGGDAIPLPMRVAQVAQDLELFERLVGVSGATARVRRGSGGAYDPRVAALAVDRAAEIVEPHGGGGAWERALASEPVPFTIIADDKLTASLEVLADFADLKSPFTAGHSRTVAALAAGAAADERERAQRAGLLHDLGRVAVSNDVWDRPGPLDDPAWERVRLHPYYTERLVARSPRLREIAEIASYHHERVDGSGYHRAVRGSAVPRLARILGAADVYAALCEPRAHRPAHAAEAAAGILRAEARGGRLDTDAVEAVLAAAGHRERRRRDRPSGLTEREVEVLRLVARGLRNREVAKHLVISERTVAHHVQNAYGKIGVTTRGAAALFAAQHDLLASPWT